MAQLADPNLKRTIAHINIKQQIATYKNHKMHILFWMIDFGTKVKVTLTIPKQNSFKIIKQKNLK